MELSRQTSTMAMEDSPWPCLIIRGYPPVVKHDVSCSWKICSIEFDDFPSDICDLVGCLTSDGTQQLDPSPDSNGGFNFGKHIKRSPPPFAVWDEKRRWSFLLSPIWLGVEGSPQKLMSWMMDCFRNWPRFVFRWVYNILTNTLRDLRVQMGSMGKFNCEPGESTASVGHIE